MNVPIEQSHSFSCRFLAPCYLREDVSPSTVAFVQPGSLSSTSKSKTSSLKTFFKGDGGALCVGVALGVDFAEFPRLRGLFSLLASLRPIETNIPLSCVGVVASSLVSSSLSSTKLLKSPIVLLYVGVVTDVMESGLLGDQLLARVVILVDCSCFLPTFDPHFPYRPSLASGLLHFSGVVCHLHMVVPRGEAHVCTWLEVFPTVLVDVP